MSDYITQMFNSYSEEMLFLPEIQDNQSITIKQNQMNLSESSVSALVELSNRLEEDARTEALQLLTKYKISPRIIQKGCIFKLNKTTGEIENNLSIEEAETKSEVFKEGDKSFRIVRGYFIAEEEMIYLNGTFELDGIIIDLSSFSGFNILKMKTNEKINQIRKALRTICGHSPFVNKMKHFTWANLGEIEETNQKSKGIGEGVTIKLDSIKEQQEVVAKEPSLSLVGK